MLTMRLIIVIYLPSLVYSVYSDIAWFTSYFFCSHVNVSDLSNMTSSTEEIYKNTKGKNLQFL